MTIGRPLTEEGGLYPIVAETRRDDGLVDFATACANARLIASAPDLLAALIETRNEIVINGSVPDDMLERAANAIKKATGA